MGETTLDPLVDALAQRVYARTWTEPKPDDPPDWHRQFPWWKAVLAARLVAEGLEQVGWKLEDPESEHGGLHQHFDYGHVDDHLCRPVYVLAEGSKEGGDR